MAKKSNNRKNNRNQTGTVEVGPDGIMSFGSEYTFNRDGGVVVPGHLNALDLIEVVGVRGELKVVGTRMEGKKLIVDCERVDGPLETRVQWNEGKASYGAATLKATGEVYGLEAVVQGTLLTASEYGIRHRNKLIWVRQIDCISA